MDCIEFSKGCDRSGLVLRTVPTFLKAFHFRPEPWDRKPADGWVPLEVPKHPTQVLFPAVCLRYLVTILRERNLYEQASHPTKPQANARSNRGSL